LEELDQGLSPTPNALDRRAGGIYPDDVENVLADIDAVNICITRFVAYHGGSPSGVHTSA
jgi:hypothetical protein